MKEILLLEIYINIVINRHGTCSYLTLLAAASISISHISSFAYFILTFVHNFIYRNDDHDMLNLTSS